MGEAETLPELTTGGEMGGARGFAGAVLVAVVAFLAIAPTLSWSEFAYGVEKLNVATALELRRAAIDEGGIRWRTWLVPTLEGESRLRKPPMNAWVTALAVRPETVVAMSSLDPAVREAAWRDLAWQVRWPALLYACFALVGIYFLGTTVADEGVGLAAAVVAASTLYFVRFPRQALTDIPLFFWVTVANVFLARAILHGKWWGPCVGAGVALGLAMMNKGPVCLVQTVLPVLAFVAWRKWRDGKRTSDRTRRALPPIVVGTLLFLLVGGAWFVFVSLRHEGTGALWWKEVMRTDEAEKATGTRLDYLSLFGYLMPWTLFFVGGLLDAVGRLRRDERGGRGVVLMLVLVLVPVVVMSLFRDRKERYLLPLLGPASVVVAHSVMSYVRRPRDDRAERLGVGAHWLLLLFVGPGIAVAGATTRSGLTTRDGAPWFSPGFAVLIAIASIVVVISCWSSGRRSRVAVLAVTAAVMLVGQMVFYHGYARSPGGTSEMKPLAQRLWEEHPDVEPFNLRGDGKRRMAPNDLSVYLNRVTRIVPSARDVPPSARPQVYLELWDRPGRDPEPRPAEGWTFYAKVPRGAGWWFAFIRLPNESSR